MKRERERDEEETIRCLFSSMISSFFPRVLLYIPLFDLRRAVCFLFSHFCAGTIVYKSFDSAGRREGEKKEEKKGKEGRDGGNRKIGGAGVQK